GSHAPARTLQGVVVLAGLLQESEQLPQRLEVAVGEPFPLLQDPAIVVAGKQFAAIGLDRLGQILRTLSAAGRALGALEGSVEGGHMGGDHVWAQPNGCTVCRDDAPRGHAVGFQVLTEPTDFATEVVAAGGGDTVWPEQLDEGVAKMSASGIIGEIGKEGT